MTDQKGHPNSAPRPSIGPTAWVVLALLAIAAAATARLGSEQANEIGALAMMIGTGFAGYLFITKSRDLPQAERRAWRMVGVGFCTFATGIVMLAVTWVATDYTAAFGPPDLLYMIGYVVGMTGVGLLPHTVGNRLQRLRLLIDGIIGAVAVAALLWVFLYAEVAAALAESPTWERLVGSAYPLLDIIALIVMMIVIVRRSSHRYDPRLAFIAVGVLAQAAADMTFLLTGAGKAFAEAEPVFPLHLLAIASFLAAAAIVDRPIEARQYADRPSTPLWAMALPYGTAVIMILVLLLRGSWSSANSSDTALFAATLAVGVLVIARQSVAIRENRRFVESQRTDLVASISHELRTPLTAMVGFLELLDAGVITDESERLEMTGIVTQQASYLSQVVSDLVMLASHNINTMNLEIGSTAVDKLVWSAVNTAAVDPSIVRVETERGVTAFLDEGRIRQALANLLGNAVRYGGDRVLMVSKAVAGGLVLEIHDDGSGVPQKYELTIWEKFERGPNRLNATVPGSGIGLAVTNAIAKAHGGTAGYRRSERLGGACFWIQLPGRVQGGGPLTPEHIGHLSVIDGDAKSA